MTFHSTVRPPPDGARSHDLLLGSASRRAALSILRILVIASSTTKGTASMASRGKKKTTMAKLSRESRLRERRLDKQAKKDARKRASSTDAAPFGQAPSANSDHG